MRPPLVRCAEQKHWRCVFARLENAGGRGHGHCGGYLNYFSFFQHFQTICIIFHEKFGKTKKKTAQVRGLDRASRCAEIADRALIALLKIVAECRRSDDVKAYSFHPKILSRLSPGESYSVALGFGLHVGWFFVDFIQFFSVDVCSNF